MKGDNVVCERDVQGIKKGAREELLLLLQKLVSCDIINSPINKNLTVTFKMINKLGGDLYD